MAATLDFNIWCTHFVDFKLVAQKYDAETINITVIDDWEWKNQRAVSKTEDIQNLLANGKIVVVAFEKAKYKDVGLYIEKYEDYFMYSLWINTKGHATLEIDMINSKYEQIEQFCKSLIDDFKEAFKLMAVGVETTVKNAVSMEDIIKNSYNVVMWFISRNEKVNSFFENYNKKIDGDIIILTK